MTDKKLCVACKSKLIDLIKDDYVYHRGDYICWPCHVLISRLAHGLTDKGVLKT